MITINLAPPDTRARRASGPRLSLRAPQLNLGSLFIVLYAATAIGLGGWLWQLSSREAALTMDVRQANDELTALKARVGQAGKVKEQVAELKKRVDAIQELTRGQARPVVLFDSLVGVVPADLWLTNVEERGTTIRILGSAFSSTAVADFMSNLRSSGRFKEVDIVIARQDLSKNPRLVTFEVTCRFES
jgi:Tfp pilus assembly protein PilN